MNDKKVNNKMKDVLITIIIITICFISLLLNKYNNTFLGAILIFINIYMTFKYRKNKLIFCGMLIILYFNYSFVITRYIGEPSSLLNNLYAQLINNDTLNIAIIIQIIFLCIVNIIIGNCKSTEKLIKDNYKFNNVKYKQILIIALQLALILILAYHLISNISYNTTLLEYSIILFIFIFYYSRENKKNKIFTEIILILFSIYSLKNGDRIAVLQFLLADFIINYLDKLKIKNLILCLIMGIFIFTFAGLYGDFLDYGYDFKNLTFSYVVNQIKERRFALDTSVSAYFSGVSMIDVADNYSIEFRINNAVEYFVKYTVLGSKANYKTLDLEIRKYQVNYGGGLPTCYFYFWMGWIGVIIISIYIGSLFRIINKENKNEYMELLSLFIISTIPRWYLYVPTLLFRGIIIFSIFYSIIKILFLKNKKFYIGDENNNGTIS